MRVACDERRVMQLRRREDNGVCRMQFVARRQLSAQHGNSRGQLLRNAFAGERDGEGCVLARPLTRKPFENLVLNNGGNNQLLRGRKQRQMFAPQFRSAKDFDPNARIDNPHQ